MRYMMIKGIDLLSKRFIIATIVVVLYPIKYYE